eukprot:gene23674-34264_t
MFPAWLWLLHAVGTSGVLPDHLQVNYQRAPALGVGPTLRFSWATSYHIVITALDTGVVVWNSGVVKSPDSINVELDAKSAGLKPGTAYSWTVKCGEAPSSLPSLATTFVTALWDGFDSTAKYIWAADTALSQHYALFRHVLNTSTYAGGAALQSRPQQQPQRLGGGGGSDGGGGSTGNPRTVKRALLYITSWVEPTMLSAYTFYVDGTMVALGPGRGEHGTVLAVVGMAPLYQTPCNLHVCKDPNTDGGGILAQLVLTYTDGTKEVVTTGGNAWQAK